MALREEFESSGVWLFRWRSYLPLALLLLIAPAMRDFEFLGHSRAQQNVWELFCFLVSLSGIVVRGLVVGRAPSGTSGRTTKQGPMAHTLVTSGFYSIVRHPLYVGNFLAWLGIALVPRSGWLVVTTCLAFWLYYERIMFAEEEYLRRSFGPEYEAWAERTPAFVPRLSSWRPAETPFFWRNVLRREYSGLLAVTAFFAALDLAGSYIATGRPDFRGFGPVVFAVSLIPCTALLILNKMTSLLRVPGY
jgi:protein-S-isoprenylcysteine O-methyltransferase Ste14